MRAILWPSLHLVCKWFCLRAYNNKYCIQSYWIASTSLHRAVAYSHTLISAQQSPQGKLRHLQNSLSGSKHRVITGVSRANNHAQLFRDRIFWQRDYKCHYWRDGMVGRYFKLFEICSSLSRQLHFRQVHWPVCTFSFTKRTGCLAILTKSGPAGPSRPRCCPSNYGGSELSFRKLQYSEKPSSQPLKHCHFPFSSARPPWKGLPTCTVMTQDNCTATEIMHESLGMRPRKGHRLPHYLSAFFCFSALPFFILRKCFWMLMAQCLASSSATMSA